MHVEMWPVEIITTAQMALGLVKRGKANEVRELRPAEDSWSPVQGLNIER
jgi:hypothetical protein